MLVELLELLKTKRTYSIEQLAIELNTSMEIVTAHLEYLETLQYVKKQSLECGTQAACANCSGCSKYRGAHSINIWETME